MRRVPGICPIDFPRTFCYSIPDKEVEALKVRNMAQCALFAALLCVCAWIAVPLGDVSFTLQTFGVSLTLGLLGGKRGSIAIFVYLVLGAVGCPVFSGLQGGFGPLLGATGGYILGFLVWGLCYWLITALLGESSKIRILATVVGLAACYCFGCVWFYRLYLQGGSAVTLGFVMTKCVVPYLLPDAVKLTLSWLLTHRLKRFIV